MDSKILKSDHPLDACVELPNQKTIAALLEAEHLSSSPSVQRYSDVEEALRALKESR